jgi:hypothetical protein
VLRRRSREKANIGAGEKVEREGLYRRCEGPRRRLIEALKRGSKEKTYRR